MRRTNARGRHTYVPEFKRWIVEQAMKPGMSVAGLAMSNQVNANQLRRWVQVHGQALPRPGSTTTLLPVSVVAQVPAAVPATVPTGDKPAVIEIVVADATVRVREGVSPATLRLVLACLRGSAP